MSRRDAKRIARTLLTGVLGAACLAVAAQPVFAAEDQPLPSAQTQAAPGTSVPQPSAGKPAVVPKVASGMTVYIDPVTGAFLKEPPPGTVPLPLLLTPKLQNAFSTSHEGLVAVPNPVPGGGLKIDLQGRFQSPLVATIDANGKVRMQHLVGGHSDDKK